jgi:hypothetical protein
MLAESVQLGSIACCWEHTKCFNDLNCLQQSLVYAFKLHFESTGYADSVQIYTCMVLQPI